MLSRTFGCQVCLTTHSTVHSFKCHATAWKHRNNMKKLFPEEKVFTGTHCLPTIIFLDFMVNFKHPIIGLSQLTVCYSPEHKTCFYLCHVCEEICSTSRITKHFYHGDHYSSYFNYTNPNNLTFAWIPSFYITPSMKRCIKKEVNQNGSGVLQILDLPINLYLKAKKGTYSEVMHLFSENEYLSEKIAAALPKRQTIQLYLKSDTRQHPLLGMQHIVECISAGQKPKTHYLCTLCRLTLTTSMVIKHVLSFDHIHSYFEAWHPSTLLSKLCYKDNSESHSSLMLNLAHKSQNSLGAANNDIKQVTLEPDVFTSVKLACYDKALKELETITKNETEHNLISSIKPRNKLEPSCPTYVIGSEDAIPAPKPTSTDSPEKVKQEESKEKCEGESVSTECGSEKPFYVIRCQDCNVIFERDSHYFRHAEKTRHQKALKRIFNINAIPHQTTFCKKTLSIFTFVKNSLRNELPIVGASLIVTILCRNTLDEPVYICFACEDCFTEKYLKQHMVSSVHLVKTLLYQNPWRLPFGWSTWEGMNLKMMAVEEEKKRGRGERMLKVLDVPQTLFMNLKWQCYSSVMETLVLYHSVLKRGVPPRETYSKLNQNDRFPLLGMQFLVKYAVTTEYEWQILCLLCKRILSKKEHSTHIFSQEHVANFLNSFHPGSISSHPKNKEILLDLAKQAARIHPTSSEQEILLEHPVWEPCNYHTLKKILASAKKRNEDNPVALEPLVTIKMKLVPREEIKECKKHVKEEITEGMNQKCSENGKATSENMPVESVKAELDLEAEVALKTCLLKKEIPSEEPAKLPVAHQKEDISERQDMSQCTEMEIDPNKWENQHKRQINQCEESKDTCLNEAVGGLIACKKQRLISNEETKDVLDDGKDVIVAPENKEWLQQFFNKSDCCVVASKVLYECWCGQHPPIYLCEGCSVTLKKESFINHITNLNHQKMSPLAVDLDEEVYNHLLNENFETSLKMVRAHLSQLKNGSEHSSSCVQPVAASVSTACEQEVNFSTDNLQVVDMEIGDSVTPPSFPTAATSVMTKASASSPGGPDCPMELVVQMTKTKDIIVNTIAPAPSSCSATCGSTAEDFSSSSTVKPTLVASNCTPANLKCNETAFRSSAATSCVTGDFIAAISILTDTNDTVTSAPSKLMGEISYSCDNTANATKSLRNKVDVKDEPKVPSKYKSASKISNGIKSSPNKVDVQSEAEPKVPPTTYISASNPTKSSPNHLDVQNGAEPKVLSTYKSASVSTPESADVCEESFKTTTSYKELSEAPSTTIAVSQTEVVSSAPTSKSQPKNGFMGKRVHRKHSVGPNTIASNIGKSNTSAAPTRSQHKPLPIEPPSIQDRQAESYQGPCSIGVDKLIKVSCEDKRQSYCQLCKVRLVTSKHTKSFKHQYEYVKLKYPRWTPDQSKLEEELRQKVAELSKIQKDANLTLKCIRVNLDVYQELAHLPEATALQRLKEMMTSRNSPSTTDPGKTTRQPVVSASPLTDSPQYEIAGLSPHNQTERGSICELKTVLAQKTELKVGSPSTPLDSQTTRVIVVRPPTQIPDTGGKTLVPKKCQKSCPVLQDTQDSTVGLKKTLSKSISSAALVRPSTLSQKAERVPRLSRCRPDQAEVFKAQDTIRLGEMVPGPSNLSRSLKVMVTEPFIGLGAIWECRGISNKPLSTIYLCECCKLKLMNSDISPHMTSINHHITYLLKKRRYKKFMYWWSDKDLKSAHKEELVRDLVGFLEERETSMDAQSVVLHLQAYDHVCKESFSNALNLVKAIQCNDKLNMPIARGVTPPYPSPSASMESQMPPVHPETTHQQKGPDRTASLSQMHTQQQPQQVTTLPIVKTNTTPGASAWVIPAVPPQQVVLVSNVVYPIVASNAIYVTPPTPQFIQNCRPQVQNQCTVMVGNSNTQPPVSAVQASTHPGFFHSQR